MADRRDDPEGVRGIEEVRERWAPLFNAKRIQELSEVFYAEDAVAIPPDHDLAHGREAIRSLFQAYADSGDVSFELGVVETHCEGDSGYLIGNYVFHDRTGGEQASAEGRTLEAYRREPDGSWKCVADMWHHLDPEVIDR